MFRMSVSEEHRLAAGLSVFMISALIIISGVIIPELWLVIPEVLLLIEKGENIICPVNKLKDYHPAFAALPVLGIAAIASLIFILKYTKSEGKRVSTAKYWGFVCASGFISALVSFYAMASFQKEETTLLLAYGMISLIVVSFSASALRRNTHFSNSQY